MALRVNELNQRVLDLRNGLLALRESRRDAVETFSSLMRREAGGRKLSTEERSQAEAAEQRMSEADRAIAKADRELLAVEREWLDERQRLGAEDAQLARRNSGRLPGSAPADDDERPAASALPAVPLATRAAIARLYPAASAVDPREREESWRGIVAAALGGQPLHPAVLAASGSEGIPGDGGFMVSPEVASWVFSRAVEESVWLRIGARLEPMTSEELIVNGLDDDDETDDAEATLKADWTEENAEASAQLMKVRQVTLHARKLLVLAACSNELAEDAPRTSPPCRPRCRARSARSSTGPCSPAPRRQPARHPQLARHHQRGEGRRAGGRHVHLGERRQHVGARWRRLARAELVADPSDRPAAGPLHVAGDRHRRHAAAGAFESGGPTGYQLLGRPVLVTSRVKALGLRGDVILADPTQLAVGIRRGITIERSPFPYSPAIGWRSGASSAGTRARCGRRRRRSPTAAARSPRWSFSEGAVEDQMKPFGQSLDIIPAFVPLDLQTARDGDWISLKNAAGVIVLLFKGAGTDGDDPTISLEQATAVAGTDAKPLSMVDTVYHKQGADLAAMGAWTKVTRPQPQATRPATRARRARPSMSCRSRPRSSTWLAASTACACGAPTSASTRSSAARCTCSTA